MLVAGAGALCLTLSGCAGAGSLGASDQTITIAMVSNSQMQDAQKLASQFEEEHPDIDLKFVSLSENEARAKITASVATGGGEFDIVMISNYETPQWAKNGWLKNLRNTPRQTEGYDADDFIPTLRESLSYEGEHVLGAVLRRVVVPRLPQGPVRAGRAHHAGEADLAGGGRAGRKSSTTPSDIAGICLRGLPGWGENLAPLDTVVNTFGGRWFDEDWNAQLTSAVRRRRCKFYVDLVSDVRRARGGGERFRRVRHPLGPGPGGDVVRRHSVVSTVESRADSTVVGKSGYAPAPSWSRATLRLALHLVAGHPGDQREPGRGVEVHLLDDRQGIHRTGR